MFGKLFKFVVFATAFCALVVAAGLGYVRYQASQLDLSSLSRQGSSTVYASDGRTVLGRIAAEGGEGKSLTDDQVSPLIRHVHMSAEDRAFYTHGAISLTHMAKAFYTDAKSGSLAAGGSTITQQYVKNAYLTQEKTAERKAKELAYAYRVEKDFGKDQILTKYVNSNYYGRGAYGIEDAAHAWFGVSATKLRDMNDPKQVARAAFLAALINQPSYYAQYNNQPSNLVHQDELEKRQRYVLDGLREIKGTEPLVSQVVVDKAKKLLPLKPTNTLRGGGNASNGDPHVLSYVRDWLAAWQTQVAIQDGYNKDDAAKQGRSMAEAMLARGGLRIVTSINATLQKQLRVSAQNNAPGQGLAHGAVITDPRTGAIVAMHSGSPRTGEAYNYALYADRQVGSIMKTVVLADAVRSGISLESVLPAPAYIKMDGSRIYNDDRQAAAGCKQSLLDAIATSNNPVHIELITGKMASCKNPSKLQNIESNYPVSPSSVATLARKMGADDSLVPGKSNPAKLPEVPTLALGVGSMTPVKVATIGSTLANGGTHVAPHLLEQIVAIDGEVVYQNETTRTRVLNEQDAAKVNQALTGVFKAGGTAEDRQVSGHPMAGKTGTTRSDAWGLMYSAVDDNKPAYVCAAWAGYPDNRRTADNLWGATVMRLCQGFFRQALSDQPRVEFPSADLSDGRHIGLPVETEAAPAPEPADDSPNPEPELSFDSDATPNEDPTETPTQTPTSSSNEPTEPEPAESTEPEPGITW
jgi:membrane peptidoglycan carboxypeptidase